MESETNFHARGSDGKQKHALYVVESLRETRAAAVDRARASMPQPRVYLAPRGHLAPRNLFPVQE